MKAQTQARYVDPGEIMHVDGRAELVARVVRVDRDHDRFWFESGRPSITLRRSAPVTISVPDDPAVTS